jgi:hypothetical protein
MVHHRISAGSAPSLNGWTAAHQRTAEHEAAHAVMAILAGLSVRSVSVDPGGRSGVTWTEAPHQPPYATEIAIAAAGLAWELRHWGSRLTAWRDAQDDILGPPDRGGAAPDRPTYSDRLRFLAAVVRVDRVLRRREVTPMVRDIATAIQAQPSGTLPGSTVRQIIDQHLGGRETRPGTGEIAVAGFTIGIPGSDLPEAIRRLHPAGRGVGGEAT